MADWIPYSIIAIVLLIFAYKFGKNAGNVANFIINIIKQVSTTKPDDKEQ